MRLTANSAKPHFMVSQVSSMWGEKGSRKSSRRLSRNFAKSPGLLGIREGESPLLVFLPSKFTLGSYQTKEVVIHRDAHHSSVWSASFAKSHSARLAHACCNCAFSIAKSGGDIFPIAGSVSLGSLLFFSFSFSFIAFQMSCELGRGGFHFRAPL